jgi:hypothetical protein
MGNIVEVVIHIDHILSRRLGRRARLTTYDLKTISDLKDSDIIIMNELLNLTIVFLFVKKIDLFDPILT